MNCCKANSRTSNKLLELKNEAERRWRKTEHKISLCSEAFQNMKSQIESDILRVNLIKEIKSNSASITYRKV